MPRAAWFVAGAVAGVYGVLRARRAAETFTPDGLRDRAAGLRLGAQLFADEVRRGAAEKETELRERLELSHDQVGQVGQLGQPRPSTHPTARPTSRPTSRPTRTRTTPQEDP